MRQSLSVLLSANVVVITLWGCRAEPPEQTQGRAVQSAQPNRAERPVPPGPALPKPIDFAADLYLNDVCGGDIGKLPFKRFESYDFIYESPLPAKVSGEYYEVRGKNAGAAATIYDEIKATIFRNVKIVVEAKQVAPHFSFHEWHMPFAVSAHPFEASRQLKHQRAMGAWFPFLDLANIPFRDPAKTGSPTTDRSNFSHRFISVVNFLATRGENIWGRANSFEERQKAREIRLATTGTEYEDSLPISTETLAALRRVPPGEKLTLSGRGGYTLITLGEPADFVAAIDDQIDAVGLRACKNGA
jgi:hypothetical protein